MLNCKALRDALLVEGLSLVDSDSVGSPVVVKGVMEDDEALLDGLFETNSDSLLVKVELGILVKTLVESPTENRTFRVADSDAEDESDCLKTADLKDVWDLLTDSLVESEGTLLIEAELLVFTVYEMKSLLLREVKRIKLLKVTILCWKDRETLSKPLVEFNLLALPINEVLADAEEKILFDEESNGVILLEDDVDSLLPMKIVDWLNTDWLKLSVVLTERVCEIEAL